MPEEALDQGQSIDDLILDILDNEAQIIRCLRVFFCETLQEIEDEKCISAERKVKLAQDLIAAAAKKEEALAAVLEAINLFEVEPDEWIPIAPWESYPLPPEPAEISRITFEAKTAPGKTTQINLSIDGSTLKTETIYQTPQMYSWPIGATVPVEMLSLTNTGDYTVYIRNLTTE